jgi:hypothetical protein
LSRLSRNILVLCGVFWVVPVFGQTSLSANQAEHQLSVVIPEVSLVKVIGSTSLSLSLTAPIEAGNPISSIAQDSSFWINYSFIKGGITRPKNHIYAKIAHGQIPAGLSLQVYAKPYVGNGSGGFGTPSGLIQLSTIEQRVIENISSCFTGTGAGNGHELIYRLQINPNQYSQLNYQSSQNVSVLYTISD